MDGTPNQSTVAIFGLGYVGCVSAACFAELGFRVVGVDVDARKVSAIQAARSPFYEPGLEPLIAKHLRSGALTATLSTEEALRHADYAFLCVGTPSAPNGNLNLDYLRKVAAEIGAYLDGRSKPLTVVVRSTVFPGTCDEVVAPAVEPRAIVVSNPEFLREGSAVKDFMEPSLVVVGSHNRAAAERVASLYAGLPVQTSVVALRTAELIKYTCNTFHALKIAFANEIGTLSAALGLDGAEVMETICSDTKLNISPVYMKPGFAFGGSCLPKDLRGLTYRARQLDLDLPLLNSVLPSNEAHISRAFRRVMEMGCRKIGVYGLAFKPNTDDLRESPGVALIERLIGKGCDVKIYDPHIQLDAIYGSNQAFLLSSLPHIGRSMENSLQAILAWADLIVVTQEPNAESQSVLAQSPVLIINVASAEAAALPKLEAVK
ncbi:MAG TPA: UDP-glucose/GDP-mannose dehydrogenase family protein [Candidatus Eisenbacteria bacterium]|nr:UDP-glucose/GDP-mannose dehydrogenase family protein [Candidatus Eisenbacteria bacterium]